jgi:hypothetical protein
VAQIDSDAARPPVRRAAKSKPTIPIPTMKNILLTIVALLGFIAAPAFAESKGK